MRFTVIVIFLLLCSGLLKAQKFSGGFKGGYNINQQDMKVRLAPDGSAVESYDNGSGFHVGAIVNCEFTKYFGLRTHLIYTQRGFRYLLDTDESYLVLRSLDGDREAAIGSKRISMSVNNSYLEIPLLAYFTYKNFEIAAGPSLGFMVSSSASGSIRFDGQWRGEEIVVDPSVINHQYYSDRSGSFISANSYQFSNGFEEFYFPQSHTAYYELNEKDKPRFSSVNYGLTGEVNYYFNKGLFIGITYYYGLNDVTNIETDLDLYQLSEEGNLQLSEEDDRLHSIRFSVGFRF